MRPRQLRELMGLLAALAFAATAAGRAGAVKTPALATFRGHGIAFSHPSEWKARFAGYITPPYGPAAKYLIVALSTERLHNPSCRSEPQPDGTSRRVCDTILKTLPADGVYVTWWESLSATADKQLTNERGNPTRIDGVFAKIVIDSRNAKGGSVCPDGTTGSVQLHIAPAGAPGHPGRGEITMDACANTTNFPHFMSQLLPMLRSVKIRPRR
jgi:hypothetical protein